jgi:uncharacterized protein with ATP-grasp and redox domains
MQSTVDCVPCYIKQVISTLRTAGLEEREHYSIINALYPTIAELDPSKTPAENTSLVLFNAYCLMGQEDPFREAKAASNQLARTFLPALERIISFSENPLLSAVILLLCYNTLLRTSTELPRSTPRCFAITEHLACSRKKVLSPAKDVPSSVS